MYYFIEIQETLSKTIEIKADSKEEALNKAQNLYAEEYFVLTADNHDETHFTILGDGHNESAFEGTGDSYDNL